jgi:hypothetical protein
LLVKTKAVGATVGRGDGVEVGVGLGLGVGDGEGLEVGSGVGLGVALDSDGTGVVERLGLGLGLGVRPCSRPQIRAAATTSARTTMTIGRRIGAQVCPTTAALARI